MKRFKITAIFFTIVMGVIFVEGIFATDYYVASDGCDVHDGLTPETAWKTITFALSQITGTASNPHTIHVAPGTYSASLTGETFPLNMKSHVSLQGAGAEVTILDAENHDNVTVIICYLFVSNLTIDGFTVEGGDTELVGAGIWCDGENTDLVISNNVIRDNTASVSGAIAISSVDCYGCIAPRIVDNIITENRCFFGIVCTLDSLEVTGNVISENEGGGIYSRGLGAVLKDNWIENNTSAGVDCSRSSFIIGNMISGNGGYGIYHGASSSIIVSNIIRNNGEVGIAITYGSPIIGGSEGVGNDIYGHWWHQLDGYRNGVINAQYNYFGVPVPTSEEVFPFESFDVSNWRDTSIVTNGDINRDEIINVIDIVLAVKFITGVSRPTPFQLEAADLNGDRVIDVGDILGIVNIILYQR